MGALHVLRSDIAGPRGEAATYPGCASRYRLRGPRILGAPREPVCDAENRRCGSAGLGRLAGMIPGGCGNPDAALSCRRIYNRYMENGQFFQEAFSAAIISAGARARLETLEAGVPVFYRDWKRNVDVMEQPDGRKFEVCFIAGAPRESNYRVIRELDETAA